MRGFGIFLFYLVQEWMVVLANFQDDSGVQINTEDDPVALQRIKRQAEESSTKITSTKLCPESQYNEFASDFGVCFENAITKFLDTYIFDTGNDLANERATCTKYKDQAKCFVEGGPRKIKCWDSQEANNRKLNFLYKKHQEVTINGTSEEGQNFIDACSAFANFENDYLVFNTDCSSCCSFKEFERKYKEWANCLDETLLKAEQRRTLAVGIGGQAGR